MNDVYEDVARFQKKKSKDWIVFLGIVMIMFTFLAIVISANNYTIKEEAVVISYNEVEAAKDFSKKPIVVKNIEDETYEVALYNLSTIKEGECVKVLQSSNGNLFVGNSSKKCN